MTDDIIVVLSWGELSMWGAYFYGIATGALATCVVVVWRTR